MSELDAGDLGASEHSEMDPTNGSVVHLVLACTPWHWDRGGVCMETLYIDDLLAGKEDCIDNIITVFTLQYLTTWKLMEGVNLSVANCLEKHIGRALLHD